MKLVIIDGLDGCGKSIQANLMLQLLKRKHKTVYLRVHPETDNWFGVKARVYLYSKGKSAHFASALFYMVDVVRSIMLYSWRQVDYVIFVRYLMGTAYLPSSMDTFAYNFFSTIVPKSDAMFFLDVNPAEAATRIAKNRVQTEMFENLNALKKIRAKAIALTRFDKWVIIDSNLSVEKTALEINANLFNQKETEKQKEF
jgi:dTMP kinase